MGQQIILDGMANNTVREYINGNFNEIYDRQKASSIYTGEVDPVSSEGYLEFDCFINTVTWDFLQLVDITWTLVGNIKGGNGGINILFGEAAPVEADGGEGDFYIQTQDYFLYKIFYKHAENWNEIASVKSEIGTKVSITENLVDIIPPIEGQIALLKDANGNMTAVYERVSNEWVEKGSFGAGGFALTHGENIPAVADGNNGDYHLKTLSGDLKDIYCKSEGLWEVAASIAEASGVNILHGITEPGEVAGAMGDYYFLTMGGYLSKIYIKSTLITWSLIADILTVSGVRNIKNLDHYLDYTSLIAGYGYSGTLVRLGYSATEQIEGYLVSMNDNQLQKSTTYMSEPIGISIISDIVMTKGIYNMSLLNYGATWAPGDKIYLDNSNAGMMTNVKPTASGSKILYIGRVIASSRILIDMDHEFTVIA